MEQIAQFLGWTLLCCFFLAIIVLLAALVTITIKEVVDAGKE